MAKRFAFVVLMLAAVGCTSATDDCPETLYWNPLTCRCHSGGHGGFVDTQCCLRDGVGLDACPQTDAGEE